MTLLFSIRTTGSAMSHLEKKSVGALVNLLCVCECLCVFLPRMMDACGEAEIWHACPLTA